MKKALLKKIPVVEAGIKDKQYMELCRQNYLMKVQKATVAHKRTLILNLYDAENIIKEQYQPFCCKLRSNGMPVPLLRNCYSIFNGTKYR